MGKQNKVEKLLRKDIRNGWELLEENGLDKLDFNIKSLNLIDPDNKDKRDSEYIEKFKEVSSFGEDMVERLKFIGIYSNFQFNSIQELFDNMDEKQKEDIVNSFVFLTKKKM